MTQVYITISIIAVAAALVCYIFIRQTMVHRQQEKDRLIRALSKRAKELMQILSVFPDEFLHKELKVFVYRCVIDAYQQLTKLVPEQTEHVDSLKAYSAQLDVIIRKPENKANIRLQSAAQINELRQYLGLLGRFLQTSLQRNNITQKQFGHYRLLIKGLNTKLAVDGYTLSAKQALEIQKNKLAIHYYQLGKKLLTQETPPGFKEQLQEINTRLAPLLEQENIEESVKETGATQQVITQDNDEDKQWAEFQEDQDWKKKNVYD